MAGKSQSQRVREAASKRASDLTDAERDLLREAFLGSAGPMTLTLEVDGATESFTVEEPRTFTKGSVGYYVSIRVRGKSGLKFLANVPVVVVGTAPSKDK